MEINKNIMSGIVEKIVLSTLFIILIGCNFKKNPPSLNNFQYPSGKDIKKIKMEDKKKIYSSGVIIMDNTKSEDVKCFTIKHKNNEEYMYVNIKKAILRFNGMDTYDLYRYEQSPDFFKRKYKFKPLLFYPETGEIIIFEALNKIKNSYFVIVTTDRTEKILENKNNLFIYEPWSIFLMKVEISPQNGVLYLQPKVTSRVIKLTNFYTFKVLRILNNEWLEVSCENENCKDLKNKKLYVRWRNKNDILINFFFDNL